MVVLLYIAGLVSPGFPGVLAAAAAAAKVSKNLDSKAAAADKVARKTKMVMVRKTIVDDLLLNPLGDSLASSAA